MFFEKDLKPTKYRLCRLFLYQVRKIYNFAKVIYVRLPCILNEMIKTYCTLKITKGN